MEKRLAIVNGEQVQDIVVRPGTTTADVRNQLGLPREYFLSKREGMPFGDTEDIYGQVVSGEKLHASPPATVGAGA